MAGSNDQNTLLNNSVGRVYSFSEAIDFMKVFDRYPTNPNIQVKWIDAKTGKPVIIGYTLTSNH